MGSATTERSSLIGPGSSRQPRSNADGSRDSGPARTVSSIPFGFDRHGRPLQGLAASGRTSRSARASATRSWTGPGIALMVLLPPFLAIMALPVFDMVVHIKPENALNPVNAPDHPVLACRWWSASRLTDRVCPDLPRPGPLGVRGLGAGRPPTVPGLGPARDPRGAGPLDVGLDDGPGRSAGSRRFFYGKSIAAEVDWLDAVGALGAFAVAWAWPTPRWP